MKGNSDDTVGFNRFDICLALGVPLVLDTDPQIPNDGDGSNPPPQMQSRMVVYRPQ